MLEIIIPGVTDPLRVTSNNENVTWRGESWIAFPFELADFSDESKGEVPRVELRVSNVGRVFESYLQDYDIYTKLNGYTPIEVRIYVVNNAESIAAGVVTDTGGWGAVTDTGTPGALTDTLYAIINPDPEVEYLYELIQPKTSSVWATFTLGAANPFNQRYPQARIMKNHCRFVFKGALCGYAGAGATCDKTLTACRSFTDSANHDPPRSTGNSKRFGGFPGVGYGGIRIVN